MEDNGKQKGRQRGCGEAHGLYVDLRGRCVDDREEGGYRCSSGVLLEGAVGFFEVWEAAGGFDLKQSSYANELVEKWGVQEKAEVPVFKAPE